jgi:hypothetical protein
MVAIRTPVLCLSAAAVLVVSVRFAESQDVCDHPANLTTNCAFTSGYSGWTLLYGQDFLSSRDGHNASGSLEGTSVSVGAEELYIFQCITPGFTLSGDYQVGSWVKVVSGQPSNCTAHALYYSDSACTPGFSLGWTIAEIVEFNAGWNWMGNSHPALSGAGSVAVQVGCIGPSAFTLRIDDVYYGQGIGPIFIDGFESGDTTAWSVTSP